MECDMICKIIIVVDFIVCLYLSAKAIFISFLYPYYFSFPTHKENNSEEHNLQLQQTPQGL